jgi:hypothetical protein
VQQLQQRPALRQWSLHGWQVLRLPMHRSSSPAATPWSYLLPLNTCHKCCWLRTHSQVVLASPGAPGPSPHPFLRLHAVIQFRGRDGAAFVFDPASTHGTYLNKKRVPAGQHVQLRCAPQSRFFLIILLPDGSSACNSSSGKVAGQPLARPCCLELAACRPPTTVPFLSDEKLI